MKLYLRLKISSTVASFGFSYGVFPAKRNASYIKLSHVES